MCKRRSRWQKKFQKQVYDVTILVAASNPALSSWALHRYLVPHFELRYSVLTTRTQSHSVQLSLTTTTMNKTDQTATTHNDFCERLLHDISASILLLIIIIIFSRRLWSHASVSVSPSEAHAYPLRYSTCVSAAWYPLTLARWLAAVPTARSYTKRNACRSYSTVDQSQSNSTEARAARPPTVPRSPSQPLRLLHPSTVSGSAPPLPVRCRHSVVGQIRLPGCSDSFCCRNCSCCASEPHWSIDNLQISAAVCLLDVTPRVEYEMTNTAQ